MFLEDSDEFSIRITGVNILKVLKKKGGGYKNIYFNLPSKVAFKGIVDEINFRSERNVTVDGLMYLRGELVSVIVGYDNKANAELFKVFFGLITKKFINFETLQNGHNFVGVSFHHSGFSFEGMEDADNLQEFFFKKKGDSNRTKSVSPLKNQSLLINDPISKSFNPMLKSPNISVSKIAKNNVSSIQLHNDDKSLDASTNLKNLELNLLKKKSSGQINLQTDIPKSMASRKRINKNSNEYSKKTFLKVVNYMNKVSKTDTFITCFSLNFIYKIFFGSWADLNFFEINYNNMELIPLYLKYNLPTIKAIPISEMNLKMAFRLTYVDFHFFDTLTILYGDKQWKAVADPLINDTRFREDLLWLLRYHQLSEQVALLTNNPENKPKNKEKTEELDIKIFEAFLNASKWRDLIETYHLVNISSIINPSKKGAVVNETKQ
jgi:hypothetical protein